MGYKREGLVWGIATFLVFAVVIGGLVLTPEAAFVSTGNGLRYRIEVKGRGEEPKAGHTLLIRMKCETESRESIFDTEEYGFPALVEYDEILKYDEEIKQYKDPYRKKTILPRAVIMLRNQGDSMIFRVDAQQFFEESFSNFDEIAEAYKFPKDKDPKVHLHLELIDIMTEKQLEKWTAEQQLKLQKQHEIHMAQQIAQEAQQKAKDIKSIEQYLQDKKISAKKTDSGLYYIIESSGKGSRPKKGDKVKVNYTGYLINGKIFDTSLEAVAKANNTHNPERPYVPISFQVGVGQVIRGWDEGMTLLRKGAKAKLIIPSALGYRDMAMGDDIPANSILIFEVELVDIEPAENKG